MSAAYWSQWSDLDIVSDYEEHFDIEGEECHENDGCCPKCSGCGCNYCLMLD